MQQSLMVAALSCNDVPLYNAFVTGFRSELQASDKALLKFFRRLKGGAGTAAYHSFKTKLANGASSTSIGDITAFCAAAKVTFDVALAPQRPALAVLVASQPVAQTVTYTSCTFQVAVRLTKPGRIPIPVPKPGFTPPPAGAP